LAFEATLSSMASLMTKSKPLDNRNLNSLGYLAVVIIDSVTFVLGLRSKSKMSRSRTSVRYIGLPCGDSSAVSTASVGTRTDSCLRIALRYTL
jgi:hypothetical protein